MGFLNYTKKAVSRAANFIKGLFSKTRNTVTGLFKGKSKRSRSSSARTRKNVVQAEKMPANSPEQTAAAPSSPAPPPPPPPSPANMGGPVPPQAAGKKMRSKNLRGMKFYKPSRKATRRSKTSRRRL